MYYMANKQITHAVTKQSLLSQFHLGYELDKTWKEAKLDVKARTER